MPQFDTFAFFSQLFWVFTLFSLFYLALSYYLLPSIAINMKVRSKKLGLQKSSGTKSVTLLASYKPLWYTTLLPVSERSIYSSCTLSSNKVSLIDTSSGHFFSESTNWLGSSFEAKRVLCTSSF